MSKTTHIAIFASGSGTNAEQIMKHFAEFKHVKVKLVLSNKAEAGVLARAEKFNVPSRVFSKAQFEGGEVQKWLEEAEVNLVVLAGFLWKIPSALVAAFEGRMVNIHPALLPAYGGKGMYGMHVHEAVKAANEKQTGITIHLVNENYDEGAVLFQARTAIDKEDTPEDIAKKVHALEHQYFPRIIEALCKQI